MLNNNKYISGYDLKEDYEVFRRNVMFAKLVSDAVFNKSDESCKDKLLELAELDKQMMFKIFDPSFYNVVGRIHLFDMDTEKGKTDFNKFITECVADISDLGFLLSRVIEDCDIIYKCIDKNIYKNNVDNYKIPAIIECLNKTKTNCLGILSNEEIQSIMQLQNVTSENHSLLI